MASANLPFWSDQCLRNDLFDVRDPGDGNNIVIENKGFAVCKVVTAGTETRVLEQASNFGVGQQLLVIHSVDGGQVTIDSDAPDVVLTAVGDWVLYVVVPDGDERADNAWKVLASNVSQSNVADTSAATEIPATPDAADAVVAILELTTALAAAGIISDNFTQA